MYGDGISCIWYSGYPIYGAGKWSHNQILDIHAAVVLLVQTDGQRSGLCLAMAAFAKRDPSFFEGVLTQFKQMGIEIYWSRNDDFTVVRTDMGTCNKN